MLSLHAVCYHQKKIMESIDIQQLLDKPQYILLLCNSKLKKNLVKYTVQLFSLPSKNSFLLSSRVKAQYSLC